MTEKEKYDNIAHHFEKSVLTVDVFRGVCCTIFFQFDDRCADLVSVHFQYLSYTCDIFNTCMVIICCFIGFFSYTLIVLTRLA